MSVCLNKSEDIVYSHYQKGIHVFFSFLWKILFNSFMLFFLYIDVILSDRQTEYTTFISCLNICYYQKLSRIVILRLFNLVFGKVSVAPMHIMF